MTFWLEYCNQSFWHFCNSLWKSLIFFSCFNSNIHSICFYFTEFRFMAFLSIVFFYCFGMQSFESLLSDWLFELLGFIIILWICNNFINCQSLFCFLKKLEVILWILTIHSLNSITILCLSLCIFIGQS